ncbi:N-acetylgalactosaminyltransferase 7 [Branchiostoma belcheri]|nr:N-acetylgalactosaminyltransferase 7 [Branchiostoma belcheri]
MRLRPSFVIRTSTVVGVFFFVVWIFSRGVDENAVETKGSENRRNHPPWQERRQEWEKQFQEDKLFVPNRKKDNQIPQLKVPNFIGEEDEDEEHPRHEHVKGAGIPHVDGLEVDLKAVREGRNKEDIRHEDEDVKQPQVGAPRRGPEIMENMRKSGGNVKYRPAVMKPGELGNWEPEPEKISDAPGEGSVPFKLGPEYKEEIDKSIKEFGFNIVASDKISLDRTIKDIRDPECKYWHYDTSLPNISVIIVFYNEAWSVVMRTVHSVIKRTPPELLAEIVLVDDFSTKEHWKQRLDDYLVQFKGLVKLVRNKQREGLIQARSIGARSATRGKILVYLDSHCEVGINWAPALISPIAVNRTTCTVPLIDVIDGNNYNIYGQGGGDEYGHARGAWDWSLLWKRVPNTPRERARHKYHSEPYRYVPQGWGGAPGAGDVFQGWGCVPEVGRCPMRSPAMAGGLFAIDREYFFELGLYDPGLKIWGGENFEISYKVWQCGGQLLFTPCSRVGHIYRLKGWNGNPTPKKPGENIFMQGPLWFYRLVRPRTGQNTPVLRVVQPKVWMCGGQVLNVPCSRVGHIYRMVGWGGNPPPKEGGVVFMQVWQCGGQVLSVPCSRVGHIYRLEGWAGSPPPEHSGFSIVLQIWQCGGEVLFTPCSRIGHIYRLEGWAGNPPPANSGLSVVLQNYMRVVEVWWDEYKEYFYASRPEIRNHPFGDISELVAFRERNHCKSFKWFMEEIAYDIVDHFPLPPKNKIWGEIRGIDSGLCLDSMGHKDGGEMGIGGCHGMGGNQMFRLNEANEMAQYDQCIHVVGTQVKLDHCDTGHTKYRGWEFDEENKMLRHKIGKCLDRSEILHQVFMSDCDDASKTQKWEFNQVMAM